MKTEEIQRLRILLSRSRRGFAIGQTALAEAHEMLDRIIPPDRTANLMGSRLRDPASLFHRPIVDPLSMTVTWGGHTCLLRSRVLLALMLALARRPDHFLPFDRLREIVWEGARRSDDTIRSTVRLLKAELVKAEMGELAQHICSAGLRYGLISQAH